ncbi:MAG: DUF4199 domain-containing protein [Bacteroidota bacterium]
MKGIAIEIKWAFIFVLITLAWMAFERAIGLHDRHIDKHAIYTMLYAIPAIAVYVFALLDKRKNHYNGTMTYKQGFISGLIVTAIVTLLVPLNQYITSSVVAPGYFSNIISYVVEEERMTLEEAQNYFNLRNYIMQGLVSTPVMGIITTAVVSFFTSSKKKKSEEFTS